METLLKSKTAKWIFRLATLGPAIFVPIEVLVLSTPVDPALKLNHEFGEWTLKLLTFNLAIGILWTFRDKLPQKALTVLRFLIPQRRWLGLAAFGYLTIHIFFYFANEAFEAKAIDQLVTKTYLIYALCAATIFTIMAITSNNFSVRKLGGRHWKNLHRLVYIALAFIAGHVLLIEKADLVEFGSWLGILALAEIVRYIYFLRRSREKAST